jgi:hypothetical protein
MANKKRMTCFVYVMGLKDGGAILPRTKIGISEDPERRRKQIATGSPWEPFIYRKVEFANRLDARRKEAELHDRLSDVRCTGEWFDGAPATIISRVSSNLKRDGALPPLDRGYATFKATGAKPFSVYSAGGLGARAAALAERWAAGA